MSRYKKKPAITEGDEGEPSHQIEYDYALMEWVAHQDAAARVQRKPSLYFFPDVSAAQVTIERAGAGMGLAQPTIDLAIERLNVYAILSRQEDGWERTRRTRIRHRQCAQDNPELWQASDVLVMAYIVDHQAQRKDALEFGASLNPNDRKDLN
jgi:hypothetical protein